MCIRDRKVIEVERVRLLQSLVVVAKHGSTEFPRRLPGFLRHLVWRLSMTFRAADAGLNGSGADNLLVDLEFLHRSLHHLHLIRVVVDREVAGISELVNFTTKQPHAERMKGRNERIAGSGILQEVPDPELHLICSLVGKGYGKNGIRTDSDAFDQVNN